VQQGAAEKAYRPSLSEVWERGVTEGQHRLRRLLPAASPKMVDRDKPNHLILPVLVAQPILACVHHRLRHLILHSPDEMGILGALATIMI
jgi:hypothetical protein